MSNNNAATTGKSEAEVADKAKIKAQREEQKRKDNLAQYPHCDPETIRWEPTANKYSVEIISVVSGKRRRVFTSDVFQIDRTEDEMKARKADRKAKQKQLLARAKEMIAAGDVK